jgi:alanine racemase
MIPSCKLTSKQIRKLSKNAETTIQSKLLADIGTDDMRQTLVKVTKLKNTRQKNIFLRIYNNDIYSKEKLHHFGLIDTPNCPKCGATETKLHLIYECPQVLPIWNKLEEIINGTNTAALEDIFVRNKNATILKIKIEILGLLIQKNRSPFGVKETIDCVLNKLMQVEKYNQTLKKICKDLKQKLYNTL